MKVLIDECLPHQLRLHLRGHDVSTVRYLGWNGLKNGSLLREAEDAGFEVFVTSDQRLPDQQNMEGRSFGVVVLSEQQWELLGEHIAKVQDAVDRCLPGSVRFVVCG